LPDAMGLGLYFSEGEGPKFKNPIQNLQTIEQLPTDCRAFGSLNSIFLVLAKVLLLPPSII
jgi:uroporphyrinogen-III decarboxylase